MRIVNKTGLGQDTKVLDSDGKDITQDLGVTRISIDISSDSYVTATLTCELKALDIDVPEAMINIDMNSPGGYLPAFGRSPIMYSREEVVGKPSPSQNVDFEVKINSLGDLDFEKMIDVISGALNKNGLMTTDEGVVEGLDLSDFYEGENLYLSQTEPGKLYSIRPWYLLDVWKEFKDAFSFFWHERTGGLVHKRSWPRE